jgi:peptidoglycan L-alanyl-D-glutamate endopeptidase CwlK
MSNVLFKGDILFLQRVLAVSGFYKGKLSGKFTPEVDAAEQAFQARTRQIRDQLGEFDARTESNIANLLPAAQIKAREFMNAVKGLPLTYRILSGTRTYAEQDVLFKKRPKVTNARGGQSNHNFGIAWDIGIFEGGKFFTGATKKEQKAYDDLGALIKSKVSGLEWGGDWKSFKDKPHYQLAVGKSVTECRKLLEAGKPYV